MNVVQKWFPLLIALLLLSAAFGWLFQLRLGGGDVYPEYSSLRADALGTRALHDALVQIPEIEVERDYRPLNRVGRGERLVVIPGQIWQDWQVLPANKLAALNAAASSGARIVVAFRADQKREDRDKNGRVTDEDSEKKKKAQEEKGAKAKKDPKKKKTTAKSLEEKELEDKELAREWGLTFKQRWLVPLQEGAKRNDGATGDLPESVAWHSDLHFSIGENSGWQVLYRRADEPVLVERRFGAGSIVLLADAYCLSNEAMDRDRSTGLLSWLVGDFRRIVFLEGSLGVLEETGIGFLARRYGLGGALALCALLGLLYAWRRLVAFLPLQEAQSGEGAEALNYEPTAGFTALLRRSLGASDILQTCIQEWHKSRRNGNGSPAAATRLDAAWEARDSKQPISNQYNILVRTLKPR